MLLLVKVLGEKQDHSHVNPQYLIAFCFGSPSDAPDEGHNEPYNDPHQEHDYSYEHQKHVYIVEFVPVESRKDYKSADDQMNKETDK